ncbi:MAG: hypothetical protein GY803_02310 [Chloroflexi bacterium]|nr:hypothetical protein [Chloroflexota bacterium]
MKKILIMTVGVIILLGIAGCDQKSPPKDARLALRSEDVGLINRGLATDSFVFAFPTGVEAAPSGCPNSSSDHCIWICTGDDPLDGIDDETCSTDAWICLSCGNDGDDVCQDGEGATIPCS